MHNIEKLQQYGAQSGAGSVLGKTGKLQLEIFCLSIIMKSPIKGLPLEKVICRIKSQCWHVHSFSLSQLNLKYIDTQIYQYFWEILRIVEYISKYSLDILGYTLKSKLVIMFTYVNMPIQVQGCGL